MSRQVNQSVVLVNVSSLALPPIHSTYVRLVRCVTKLPIPKKGSVTKLATRSRKKARSQNSRPQLEKRLGHKTRHPIPKKGSVTKLATSSVLEEKRSNLVHLCVGLF